MTEQMLIVYHGEAGLKQRERFAEMEAQHDVRIAVCPPSDTAMLDSLLGQMDVWWHVLTPITKEHYASAPNLRLVQKWGVGVNTIDRAGARAHGVQVSNMAGSNAAAVAEQALLLLLAVFRRLSTYDSATARGTGWEVDASVGEQCREVAGTTVGLIGYGDIAQRLEKTLLAMGATVIHHSRREDRPGWRSLDELLATADVVSLHTPLTDETAHLISGDRIALMKSSAVLINTARGGLIDQPALAAALLTGALGGAGLDVFDEEPWTEELQMAQLPNVVVTPHVSWLTWETLERSLELAMQNVLAIREGTPIHHDMTNR